jgi:hypothetical protein
MCFILGYKSAQIKEGIKMIYTKWILHLMKRSPAFRHENTAAAVMYIAIRNLYFYFELCKTPLSS